MIRWLFAALVLANVFYLAWWSTATPAGPAPEEIAARENVPTLVMVDEAEQPPKPVGETSKPVESEPESEPGAALIAQTCWQLGVFDERARVDKLTESLQPLQLQLHLETTEVPAEPDYWVHVGPFDRRERALGVLQQLRARDIDSFLITDGELKNAISLGFFSKKASADRMIRRHRDLGYPVRVHRVERFRERYTLYALGRVEQATLQALLRDTGFPANVLEKPKNSCN